MTSFQINCFLEAVDTLSFTIAAEHLYTSKSSVSRQIALIEEELGVDLFDRRHNMLTLTPAGELFLEHARNIMFDFQQAVNQIRAFESSKCEKLRIGLVNNQTINTSFSHALNVYCKSHSKITPEFYQEDIPSLGEDCTLGEIDICQGPFYENSLGSYFDSLPLSTDPLCLAFSQSLLTSDKKQMTKAEIPDLLGDVPLITSIPVNMKESAKTHLPNIKVRNRLTQPKFLANVTTYVAAGITATLTTRSSVLSLYSSVQMIEITDADPLIQLIFWKRGENKTRDELLELVRQSL